MTKHNNPFEGPDIHPGDYATFKHGNFERTELVNPDWLNKLANGINGHRPELPNTRYRCAKPPSAIARWLHRIKNLGRPTDITLLVEAAKARAATEKRITSYYMFHGQPITNRPNNEPLHRLAESATRALAMLSALTEQSDERPNTTDEELLNQRCNLCRSKVTDCGCITGKSPEVHDALERVYGRRSPIIRNPR